MVQEQIITNGILKQIISVIFVFVFLVWKAVHFPLIFLNHKNLETYVLFPK